MNSLRLHSSSPTLCRQLTTLLRRKVKFNFRAFCSVNAAQKSASANGEQFKGAFLHPKKTNLIVETLTLPKQISDGQVRIGIDFCALNNFDVRCIRGEIKSIKLPYIPGSEFSGEILELGPNCKKFKVGDKVAVLSNSKLIGGGLSQQCFVSETECIRIDPRLSAEQSTSVIQGYSNAFLAFSKYMSLQEGDDIIVCAGPGGDGLAAIEVADKIFKAKVHVLYTASSINALLRDDSSNYEAMNISAGLTKVYSHLKTQRSKTFKAVYDCYDSKLLHVVADLISPNGHFMTDDPLFDRDNFEAPKFKKDINTITVPKVKKKRGATADTEASAENIEWTANVKTIDVTKYQTSDPLFYEKTVNQVFDWCATEKIEPYVSQTCNLEDVNKALNFMTTKRCLGKVLIKIDHN